jgi:RNA polymerase sigma factor (sigma-70 family)
MLKRKKIKQIRNGGNMLDEKKYLPLIGKCINKHFRGSEHYGDLLGEGYIGLRLGIASFDRRNLYDTVKGEKIKQWLYTIIKETCISFLRKQRRKCNGHYYPDTQVEECYSDEAQKNPESELNKKIYLDMILKSVELDNNLKNILNFWIEGYKIQEIAKIMHMSHSTTRYRIEKIIDLYKTWHKNNSIF